MMGIWTQTKTTNHKPQRLAHIALILCIIFPLTSCTTAVTTSVAAAVGAYESINKRERWEKYAEKGDVYAQYELAVSYCCRRLEGEIDYEQSLKWFCYAARNGSSKAQLELGRIYDGTTQFSNYTLPIDREKAFMWYSYASSRANLEASTRLKALTKTLSEEQINTYKEKLSTPRHTECDPTGKDAA